VPGQSLRFGRGTLYRYIVEVERGLAIDGQRFAATVERILGDPRGWTAGGAVALQRVRSGPVAFRVTLASPTTTDRLCAPLDTDGIYSCEAGGRVVLNAWRWLRGARAYRTDLAAYRTYLVNHEVGHALGHGHASCPALGAPAPVMVQQTITTEGCHANPWPLPREH